MKKIYKFTFTLPVFFFSMIIGAISFSACDKLDSNENKPQNNQSEISSSFVANFD